MSSVTSANVHQLVEDLQRLFSERLDAVVTYGWRRQESVHALVLVETLTMEDLTACAALREKWRQDGLATPLLLTRADFARSLDAFPIEYGEILAHHQVVFGIDPFIGLQIDTDDLRRACEVQVKSHLIHLRENYVECSAKLGDIDALVRDSAPAFAALLRHLARLDGAPAQSAADLTMYASEHVQLDSRVVDDLMILADTDGPPAIDTQRLFPAYLAEMEKLARFVDRWPSL